jgi:hypothetical protein
MSQDQLAKPPIQFEYMSGAFVLYAVVFVGILTIAVAIWLGLGPVHGVVAVAAVAGGFIYILHVLAREWVTISDDTESLELLRGEKALLRTFERSPWDNNWLRAGLAVGCAAVGAAVGEVAYLADLGEGSALTVGLWTVLFLGFYFSIKMDQALAKAYVDRAARELAEGDLAAAIGDASESLILSIKYRYEVFMLRGQIWTEVGDPERAQREFQLAWSERPGCEEARQAYRAAVNAALPDAESADVARFTHFEHLLPTTDQPTPGTLGSKT